LDDESKDTTTTDQNMRYSSYQCFNTTITDFSPADQNIIRRGVQPDNNISGPAPNTGMMPWCVMHHRFETGPIHKGGELLEPPILITTTPQRSNPWSPSYGRGIEVEVLNRKKSTHVQLLLLCTVQILNLRS